MGKSKVKTLCSGGASEKGGIFLPLAWGRLYNDLTILENLQTHSGGMTYYEPRSKLMVLDESASGVGLIACCEF